MDGPAGALHQRAGRPHGAPGGEHVVDKQDPVTGRERVLLVDDVLATGGTVAATRQLVEACGGTCVGVAVLMELSFLPGRATVGDLPITAITTV